MEKWIIEIDRMKVRARHGVHAQERVVGNDFEVSLSVAVVTGRIRTAALTANVQHTVSYAELADIISEVMAHPSDLLETVAYAIQREVCGKYPEITGGRVTVSKLTPPIPAVMDRASVTLEWNENNY